MTTLGKYELHEQLGKGGFGIVYRATDTVLGREVALKVLHPQLTVDADFIERFRNEARRIAAFDHPNIATVYDMGEENGRVFIAMRYLPGGSLRGRLKREGAIPFEEALQIVKEVGAGLKVAHAKGLIHRDIKPENILFTEDGQAVISDFGLAKAIESPSSSGSSSVGGVGTPAYRAPELWEGEPPASSATDEYSLACVFAEMLTGRQLFTGGTPHEIITQHLVHAAKLPEKWPQGTPAGIREVFAKALAKNPGDRYPNTTHFVDALESRGPGSRGTARRGPEPKQTSGSEETRAEKPPAVTKAEPAPPSYPVSRPMGKGRPLWIWLAGIVGVVCVVAAAILVAAALYTLSRPSRSQIGKPEIVNTIETRLYFTSDRQDNKAEIYSFDLVSGKTTRVTNSPPQSQSWSPFRTGDRTLYLTSNREDDKAEIYSLNLYTAELTRVTNTPGQAESWSAFVTAAGMLYFTSDRQGNKAEIYSLNLYTGEVKRVTNTPGQAQSWSPFVTDAGMLYFTSDREGSRAEIYGLNLYTGKVKRVTNTPGQAQSWSPFVTKAGTLYFTSDRQDNKAEIYSFDLVSGKTTRVTHSPPQSQCWSPFVTDAGTLYFTSDRQDNKAEIYSFDLQYGQLRRVTDASEPYRSWSGTLNENRPVSNP